MNIVRPIAIVIALMFFYAACSKLLDFDKSKREMMNQVFPKSMALFLVWAVPFTELLITMGLINKYLRLKALYASLFLLVLFSLYISITMTGIFGRVPCSCGGILRHMSYWAHLAFNFFFIVLAVLGIAIETQWTINRGFHFLIKKGGLSRKTNC